MINDDELTLIVMAAVFLQSKVDIVPAGTHSVIPFEGGLGKGFSTTVSCVCFCHLVAGFVGVSPPCSFSSSSPDNSETVDDDLEHLLFVMLVVVVCSS